MRTKSQARTSVVADAPALVHELDPHDILPGGLQDRLEHDARDHTRLMTSLRTHGQQVPILVRAHPDKPGRYQIVYGRRRVLALRDLGMSAKALIRVLDDEAALMAQGQENAARRNLSFVERVTFARLMVAAGYDRPRICAALSAHQTDVSRLLIVAEALPAGLIDCIGAAPSVGRRRWLGLAQLWQDRGAAVDDAEAMLAATPCSRSDERFEVIAAWLSSGPALARKKPAARVEKQALARIDGAVFARITRSPTRLEIRFCSAFADGFDDWLADNLSDLHRDWCLRHGGGPLPRR